MTANPKQEAVEPLSTLTVIRVDEEAGGMIRGHGINKPVPSGPAPHDLSVIIRTICFVWRRKHQLNYLLPDSMTVESTLRPAGVSTEVDVVLFKIDRTP